MDAISRLKNQISALTTQVGKLTSAHSFTANQVIFCEYCSGQHSSFECPYDIYSSSFSEAHVSYDYQWDNQGPYSNTYNPEWCYYPNFANEIDSFQPSLGFHDQDPFQIASPQQDQPTTEELMLRFMQKTDAMLESQQTTLEDLKGQISQLSEQLSNESSESLPSNTEKISKEAVFEEEVSTAVEEEDENLEMNPLDEEFEDFDLNGKNFLQGHSLECSPEVEMEELAENEEKDHAEFEELNDYEKLVLAEDWSDDEDDELPDTRHQHEREEVKILYEKEEMEVINEASNTTIEKLSKEHQNFVILPHKETLVNMEHMPQKLENLEGVTINVSCDVSFDQLLRALVRETSLIFLKKWMFEGDPENRSRDSRFLEPP